MNFFDSLSYFISLTEQWVMDHAHIMIAFCAFFLAYYLFRAFLLQRLEKMSKLTENKFDDAIVSVLRGVNWPFAIILSILLATFTDPNIHFFQSVPLSILFILILIYHVDKAVRQFVSYATVQSTGSEEGAAAVHGLQTIISLLIWSSGFLLVLSTVGYNITSLVAGLGVGGLAVALALQNILSDVFSSFYDLFR